MIAKVTRLVGVVPVISQTTDRRLDRDGRGLKLTKARIGKRGDYKYSKEKNSCSALRA